METAHRARDGARRAAPLAVAVGTFGVTFGVLAHTAGIGKLAALVFSVTTFAGSAQFAAAGVLSAGGTAAAAVLAAVLLNGRYLPIGISVAPAIRGGRLERLLRAQLVVDESWAISNLGRGRFDPRLLFGAGLAIYLAWIAGTAIGVFAGGALGKPENLGLDAAFPALFLALLSLRLRDSPRSPLAAVLGGLVALVLIPFVPAGVPIVAASAVCLLGLRR